MKDSWYNSTIHPASEATFKLAQRIARLAGRDGVLPVDLESSEKGDEGLNEGIWGGEGEGDTSGSGEEWEPSEWGR